MTRRTFVHLALAFVCGGAVAQIACSPAQRETVREVTPPATRALCVLLRAFSSSGTVDEVCATAEELAPFVPEILAARAERKDGRPVASTIAASVAFVMPEPPRPVPRRRCVAWVDLSDAGARDGGDRDE